MFLAVSKSWGVTPLKDAMRNTHTTFSTCRGALLAISFWGQFRRWLARQSLVERHQGALGLPPFEMPALPLGFPSSKRGPQPKQAPSPVSRQAALSRFVGDVEGAIVLLCKARPLKLILGLSVFFLVFPAVFKGTPKGKPNSIFGDSVPNKKTRRPSGPLFVVSFFVGAVNWRRAAHIVTCCTSKGILDLQTFAQRPG